MSEAEWLACTSPARMLEFVRPWASGRKLWLFAACCCREAATEAHHQPSRFREPERFLEGCVLVERFADGEVDVEEVHEACRFFPEGGTDVEQQAWRALRSALRSEPWEAATQAYEGADWCVGYLYASAYVDDYGDAGRRFLAGVLADDLRDLFGNPFRPPDPRRFPPGVVGVARSIYEGDHTLYPLLADALDDLGLAEAAGHCRAEGRHVKGCHVVDFVLGGG